MDILRTSDDRFLDLPDYPFEPRYVEVGGLNSVSVLASSGG
jgi:haloalkane dehalogenase